MSELVGNVVPQRQGDKRKRNKKMRGKKRPRERKQDFYYGNFDIATQMDKLRQITDAIENEIRKAVKEAAKISVKQAYADSKDSLETCVIKNDEPGAEVTQKSIVVPTKLQVDVTDNALVASVTTKDQIASDIIYANSHGTATGVKKEILDAYELQDEKVKKEDGEKTDFGAWYFDGTQSVQRFFNSFASYFKQLKVSGTIGKKEK